MNGVSDQLLIETKFVLNTQHTTALHIKASSKNWGAKGFSRAKVRLLPSIKANEMVRIQVLDYESPRRQAHQ